MRCSVEGCESPHLCGAFCPSHYYRWKRYGDPLAGGKRQDRLGPDYEPDEAGCWVWRKHRNRKGYGVKGTNPVMLAHRWYYAQAHGPIPAGLEIDHLCRNRACVNPAHLEAVTHLVNVRRGFAARRTCP